MVALTQAGSVGVDVESLSAASFSHFDSVVAHELETPVDLEARAALWVRKESLLKATGHGLEVDPRKIRLTEANDSPDVVNWDGDHRHDGPVQIFDIEIRAGYRAALTVLAEARPVVEVRPADPEARHPGASA